MSDLIPEILEAIRISSVEIEEPEIPTLEKEYAELIDDFLKNNDPKVYQDFTWGQKDEIEEKEEENKHSFIEKTKTSLLKASHKITEKIGHKNHDNSPPRTVLIGDIHCDFTALKAILHKLKFSDYDYFNKAVFIFMGDYMDRGVSAFETLRLILRLKNILKDRCILLRGNHEIILFNEETKEYYSPITPAETIDFLKEYVSTDTISKVKEFYEALPFFTLIEYPESAKKYQIVHGGVPYDKCMKDFNPDSLQQFTLPLKNETEKDRKVKAFLNSMLWGDPRNVDFKINGSSSRFEFGKTQFEAFAKHFGITHLIRGHEPKQNGYEEMYDGKLVTIFSSGGQGNPDSGYSDLVKNPAFGIIDATGNLTIEPAFTYRIDFSYSEKSEVKDIPNTHIKDDSLNPFNFLLTPNVKKDNVTNDEVQNTQFNLNPEFGISLSLSDIPESFKDKIPTLFDIILKSIHHADSTESR